MNLPRFTFRQLLSFKKLEKPQAGYFHDFFMQFKARQQPVPVAQQAQLTHQRRVAWVPTLWARFNHFLDRISFGNSSIRFGYAASFAAVVVVLLIGIFMNYPTTHPASSSSAAALAWQNARNSVYSSTQSVTVDYPPKTPEEKRREEEAKRKKAEEGLKVPAASDRTSKDFF